MVDELIKDIYKLKTDRQDLENKITYYKAQIEALDTEIDAKQKDLLNAMKDAKELEVSVGDIIATYFSKENVGYTSEKDVLNYLKENNYTTLISSKITESLNKNALKKALKENADLSKALEEMTVTTLTEWVVVTDKENHDKMLEHIEENKKGK